MTEDTKPRIGITMGDPAGIGPEVTLRTVMEPALRKSCAPVVIGDLGYLRKEADRYGLPVKLAAYGEGDGAGGSSAVLVKDLGNLRGVNVVHGAESADAGKAAAEYIMEAVRMWQSGDIEAMTTAPINKASLSAAAYDFPGHTEFLAELTNTREFRMSFMAGRLRVVLLSTHLPLRKAIDLVKKDAVTDLIRFSDRELSKLLDRKVKLAVAGLNPHASERGLFGDEESEEIQPAIEQCQMVHGIEVFGPFSPDTIFLRCHKGEFDGVISLYHDQATIAVKGISFGKGVNVTLGLPLIRTSVDHGTAFDIAGKGEADHLSMLAAVEMAADFVSIRRNSSLEAEV